MASDGSFTLFYLSEGAVAAALTVGRSEDLDHARRLIAGGGIYLNDVALPESRTLGADDLLHGRYAMLRKGKRQRHLLVSG